PTTGTRTSATSRRTCSGSGCRTVRRPLRRDGASLTAPPRRRHARSPGATGARHRGAQPVPPGGRRHGKTKAVGSEVAMEDRRDGPRRSTRWLGRWSRDGEHWRACWISDLSVRGAALSVEGGSDPAFSEGTDMWVEVISAGRLSGLRLSAEVRDV